MIRWLFANICLMKVYQVKFHNNKAISAQLVEQYEHGDVKFTIPNEKVDWYAVECSDKQTAMEIADKVVNAVWGAGRRKLN